MSETTSTSTPGTRPRLTREQVVIERAYRNVITLFLAGRLGNFSHQRHVDVGNILWHLPYGRELMHLGLQVMAYRNFIPDKYSREITDREWAKLDGTLPDPAVFADVPGGAGGHA